MLSQKSKIKNQNDKSKSKNLAFPFSIVARHDSAEEKILRLPRPDKSGLAMTTPSCRCEAGKVSRSNLGGDRGLPRRPDLSGLLAMT
jgi:hypothetical protein